MFQTKVRHPLSPSQPSLAGDVEEALWKLFVAIGPAWKLPDDPNPYRLRFRTFLENRIALNPLYAAYYAAMAAMIAELTAQRGEQATYDLIFFGPGDGTLTVDDEFFTALLQHVSFEFISFRLALGSFRAFGAINYRGYFGGANLAGEPAPYRTAEGLK